MKLMLSLFAGVALAGAVTQASAQTVAYTNGPINGSVAGNTIYFGWQVTDSFSLTAPTTLTGFSFGGWSAFGETITGLSYGFSTAPDFAIGGTALLTAGSVIPGSGRGSYDVRSYSASIAPVTLAAGTYYFALQNAVTTGGSGAFWDINNGSSSAYEANPAYGVATFSEPSHSFSLYSAVPEPATWAMMVLGFGMVGFGLRRRAKQAVRVTYA